MRANITFLSMIAAVMLLASGISHAGKDKDGKRPELKDLNLTGKVVSEEVEKKSKDGNTKRFTVFYLTTDDGKIHLPQPHAKKKGEAPPFQLASFNNANVRISAKGYTRPSKKGGMSTHVHQIVSIDRVTN